ncbi:RHS repeat protein [Pseudomonas sp. p1(2021b)]|uniref:RHS repeat domain-containing protein n=1 Tax=Pseudomonas sp. p1(2021b) TaxID=2874628 RepID=UPI001CCD2558|nr:RHS repeat domain-containing protein [Pseudomonas sp. p1(2021b)]UBM23584.1 RHS repeat protein [Pseudomonas sp. p1(2021b)]
MDTSLFSCTPTIKVFDNRGLTVRDIEFHRHPDSPSTTDRRLTHHRHDARSFLVQSADPRLHARGLANFTYWTDLAGTALRTRSVDAGISLFLADAAGRPVMAIKEVGIDETGGADKSRAITRTWQYEAPSLAGRPLSMTEQVADSEVRIAERFVWAQVTQQARDHNLLGQTTRHYDPAGLAQANSFALTGVPISTTRQLLKDADHPDIVADWQGEEAVEWDTRLAPKAYTTQTTADATGAMLTTLDAAGNLQRVAYDVAGQLSGSWLMIAGKAGQVIVQSVSYSAAGQKLREVHGNGVVTTYTYEPDTQRLSSIKTERQGTGAKVLQDLRYAYDPVGNVLKIRNDAEATRFWRNQKVVPENTYTYDSLYQLASATGREMANAGQPGRHLPHVTPFDNTTYTPYTRTYRYDTAGNLLQIRHSAPATNHNYTTDITVSDRSNRAVLSTLAQEPSAVEALFTPGGQQAVLLPGQPLAWSSRAELTQVVSVKREGATDDRESYRYDSRSQRVLKASTQRTASSTQAQRVIYLPGLELRTHTNGDTLMQELQVLTVGEAGRAQVRVLHWAAGKPDDLPNDQLRYSYDNLLGSSALEVDGAGNLISQEEYYPFGGTAVWAARNEVEASYKTVRYSGKERDATGLYYYGYRYYQPWAGRWLSADPAGTVDGLNLFRMVSNNPTTLVDKQGLVEEHANPPTNPWTPAIDYLARETDPAEQAELVSVPAFTEDGLKAIFAQLNLQEGAAASPPTRAGRVDNNAITLWEQEKGSHDVVFYANFLGTGLAAFATHGGDDGSLMNAQGEYRPAREVAEKDIKPWLEGIGYEEGKEFILLACRAGRTGAAREVARTLKKYQVRGYRKTIFVNAPEYMKKVNISPLHSSTTLPTEKKSIYSRFFGKQGPFTDKPERQLASYKVFDGAGRTIKQRNQSH